MVRFESCPPSGSNEFQSENVQIRMKTTPLLAAFFLILATISPAQTCREVVRDSSGRFVQTVERWTQSGGAVQTTTRDATGRITGTATTRPNAGGARTEYRDASGRLAGSAVTQGNAAGSARTTYRDSSGRLAGTADTQTAAARTSRTQYRDASGRLTGTSTTNASPAGSFTGTNRDASGRLTGSSTGIGKCQGVVRIPVLPPGTKK